jgi:hypothetical protein
MNQQDFYTFNGYIKRDESMLTASMEDYVEMIYRLSLEKGYIEYMIWQTPLMYSLHR